MFKFAGLEDELYGSMKKNLAKNQTYGFDKLAKATDLLNATAAIFDQVGMNEEANMIVEILQSLVEEIK